MGIMETKGGGGACVLKGIPGWHAVSHCSDLLSLGHQRPAIKHVRVLPPWLQRTQVL